jgi:hypothetical protein
MDDLGNIREPLWQLGDGRLKVGRLYVVPSSRTIAKHLDE